MWPRIVIHSPGMVPKGNLTVPQVDVTVVFGGAYRSVPIKDRLRNSLTVPPGNRSNYGF